ncbi:MAG TPA: Mpo1-like protein [Coxiellaceae bacterium]|nr:MAG: hypothetical protein A3E81_00285 [Gammaproteobacteria bacterium RIFCSPHIGHO2_12_FULL_36_30]HLB56599.1 Mpo1-like protein [Coxiellaceae bacterium]
MKSLAEQLAVYQQQHTNKLNRLMHYIGIPMIIFSLLMLFNWISIDVATEWQISFAWIFLIAALIYYFYLNVRLAIVASVILIIMALFAMWIARPSPTQFSASLFLILFVLGWVFQLLGHFFEKRKPAFLLSAKQLLIGPLFVLIEALTALGVVQYVMRSS